MTTYHIRIEIDQHVESDNCFYELFLQKRTSGGLIGLADDLERLYKDAKEFIENRLKKNINSGF